MRRLTRWLDSTLYPNHGDNWDNAAFRSIVLNAVDASTRLLDLGAGAGIVREANFKPYVAHVCGVDPDPRVLDNPHLDEARIGTGECIPYPDEYFDVVVANNVLEHLTAPAAVFREVARVLKPGGTFICKTPNRWHYVPLLAQCTPHWFHQWVNKCRGRDGDDTFPTYYRANSPRVVQKIGSSAGLSVTHVTLLEGRPEYLRMTPATYLAGWLYERAVNLVPALSCFRVIMIAALKKPECVAEQKPAALSRAA